MKKFLICILTIVSTFLTTYITFGATPQFSLPTGIHSEPIDLKIDVSDLITTKSETITYEGGVQHEVEINYVKEGSTIKITGDENDTGGTWVGFIVSPDNEKMFLYRRGNWEASNKYTFSADEGNSIFYQFQSSDKAPIEGAGTYVDTNTLKNMGYKDGATVYLRLSFTDFGDTKSAQFEYWFAFKVEGNIPATSQNKIEYSSQTKELKAIPTPSKVYMNGKEVSFDSYNIDGANYFKLRDLARALNGSDKQFDITFDSTANAINLLSKQAYKSAGGEMILGDGKAQTPVQTNSKVLLDGKAVSLTAYNINGNNYFKLRDIGKLLNFAVDWDSANNVIQVDAGKPYVE